MTTHPHSAHDRAVAVWRIALDRRGPELDALRESLVPDELDRLRRLDRTEVGRRWLVSRASLREILGAELGIPPASVRLKIGKHGRPGLDPGAHQDELDFNLSHSGELALIVSARGLRVGIDVERLRGRDPLQVADRYFSVAEVAAVRAFPPPDRPLAFLRYWTAKEALAKGLGQGLQVPRGDLELVRQPGGRMSPVRMAADWRIVELNNLPSGYCGALALDGDATRVVTGDWPPDG